jgi:pilus assembly protein CpaE
MRPEVLKVSVLYGSNNPDPAISEVLASLPQVRVLGQSHDPRDLLLQLREATPDLVIVDLNGESAPPQWLESLTQKLQHSTVLVCSPRKEPEFLIRVMQLGVREFLPMPLDRADLETALERVQAAKRQRSAPEFSLGHMLAVTGLKGGRGATSVAVNLAVALAGQYPHRVALVDLGRPFPDVGKFLDQERTHSLMDLVLNKDHLDSAFLAKILQPHKTKMAVLHGCPDLKEMALVDPKMMQKVWGILRTSFDWIVVDLGHWLDELYLSTVREADLVLLLSELSIPDLQNLKKLWGLLQQQGLNKEKVGVVVNRYHKGNGLGLNDLENIQQQPVFFTLPSDYPALSESINYGTPLTMAAPRSKLYRSLKCLADKLVERCQPEAAEAAQQKAKRRFLFF